MFPSCIQYEPKIAGFKRIFGNFILAYSITQVQGNGINYRSLKERVLSILKLNCYNWASQLCVNLYELVTTMVSLNRSKLLQRKRLLLGINLLLLLMKPS